MARYLQHGSTKAEESAVHKRPKAAESTEELFEERQRDIDLLQSSILAATRSYLQSLQLGQPVDEQVLARSKVRGLWQNRSSHSSEKQQKQKKNLIRRCDGQITYDRHGARGDYSSNMAMLVASQLKRAHQLDVSPLAVADALTSRLELDAFDINPREFLAHTRQCLSVVQPSSLTCDRVVCLDCPSRARIPQFYAAEQANEQRIKRSSRSSCRRWAEPFQPQAKAEPTI
jgi:hypothetical protein